MHLPLPGKFTPQAIGAFFLRSCKVTVWLLLATLLPHVAQAAVGCSTYRGQVFLNEVRVGVSKSSSTSNQIELYNSGGVAPAVWQTWKLLVNYQRSGNTPTAYTYALKTGFTNLGSFIYNNSASIYWRNRDQRFMDVALVDSLGNFIDYLAVDSKIQTVPSCMGTTPLINATATSDTTGDIVRLPDGGTWLANVTNTAANTIGRTNVCSSGVSDLVVSNSVDVPSPTAGTTPVTYTVTVLNKSCTTPVNGVQITDTNIVSTNFSSLNYAATLGTTAQSGNNRVWTVGNLAAGAVATLTITGTPINVGTLTTTASVTAPSSGLSNTTDDSAAASINVKDFNYVSFDLLSDSVTEGIDTTYTASISSDLVAGAPITVNYTVSGSAGSGDTDLASGSVTISPSSADTPQTAFINFNILNDYVNEPTKSIILTITSISSTDNTVKLDTAANSMNISLLDDDPVPTDTVVVRGYGALAGGVGPIMELWLNGNKVGEANVSTTSATDYSFPVALPDTGAVALDVVYTNDALVSGVDRNLFVNSVRVRGQVLLPTDTGVTYDKGDGALAFDGLNVIPGQVTMAWNGALRFNVALARPMLAEYHLEEGALSGAAGEVKDTAGYTGGPFNGQGVGSPLPTPNRSSPALAGATGTCGYASLAGPIANGGAIDLTGLPVSTTANAQTTVAFWMYWDGTSSERVIGWLKYDLWLSTSVFGFNTSNNDVQGIVPTGLANGWHHIVAVFTNGDVAQNLLYVDGVKKTLTALQAGTPNNANAYAGSSLRLGGWLTDTGSRFSGRLDEVKVYSGAISQSQVSALTSETHACPSAVIAQYRLDETTWSGTTGEVLDSSGRGNHGKASGISGLPVPLHSTPALSGLGTGTCGYGNFAGAATKQAINMGAPDFGIGGDAAFSMSAWVRWGITPSTGNQWSNIASNGSATAGQFWLQHAQTNNRFEFALKTSVNRLFVQSKTAPVVGQWYHVAGVYDGAALHIYVNGVLDDNSAVALTGTISPYQSSYQFNLGIDNALTRAFQGGIDEVQLFGGALSAGQISTLYAERHACPTYPATLLAQYHFEEASWTGAAAELKDSAGASGGPFNGVASGIPLPAPATSNPAISSKPGSCGYASIAGPSGGGGAFTVTGLPVAATAGAQSSVAFWMYWNGVSDTMPMGWNVHDLWFSNGYFGFNTGVSDIYGIASTGLANGWHHVAAVFTNGDVSQNQLYIDGVKQTISQRMGTVSNSAAYVKPTMVVGGWSYDANHRFAGLIDEFKVYDGVLTQAQVSALLIETHACPSYNLLAEWRFDETAWAGVSGEVKDSSGNGRTGRAVGSASVTGAGKICGAGDLTHSADYVDVANSTIDGLSSGVTVMGWIKPTVYSPYNYIFSNTRDVNNTDGSSYKGFELVVAKYSSPGANAANFAIWGADGVRTRVYGSTDLALNQWAHVAGTFDGSNLRLYVNGVLESTVAYSGLIASPASFSGTVGALGHSRPSYGATAQIDEVKIYDAAVPAANISAIYANENASKNWDGSSRVCPTVTVTAASFNCVETGAAANTGHLYTKLAGTSFSFDIAALRSDGTLETAYASGASRNVTVELVNGASNTACTSRSALSPIITQTLTFSASDAGRKAAANITVNQAYPDLRCRVTDASQSPNIVGCSSDDFAVRPSSLSVTSTANADSAGVSSSATPAIKTGASFSLSATSNVVGTTTAPMLDNTKLSAHSGAAQAGTLTGSFGSANAATGVATGSNFAYSEVGYFNIAANGVYDSSLTAVDSANGDCTADFSNVAVGGKFGCNFGNTTATSYFGRFTPDHFNVAISSTGSLAPACLLGSFTYTGQAMGYSALPALTITPINAPAGNGVTQNYLGAFQKLTPAGVLISTPTTDSAQLGKDGASRTALTATLGIGTLSNSGGVMTYTLKSTDQYTYTRNTNAMVPPYSSAVALAVSAVSDGEIVASSLPTLLPTGASLRFGRLRLQNVFGSEKLPLTIPVQAQHYVTNATGAGYFTNNTVDQCTSLSLPAARTLIGSALPDGAANIYFYPLVSGKNQLRSANVSATLPAVLSNGQAKLLFAAPGKQGWLDLLLAVPDYLAYNWGNCNGQGSDTLMNDQPCARATFGVFGAKSPIIYTRENY